MKTVKVMLESSWVSHVDKRGSLEREAGRCVLSVLERI